ncbi:MAG: hypothetical protein IIB77_13355, partial [Proteobacteria bacterium]|nr:hypothetical protein [Pseudomonadota bacterium]
SKFSSSVIGNVAVATNATGGDITDATAGDSGFTVNVTTQGVNAISSLDGKFFTLSDDVGTVAFWFDVDDSGTTVPAGAGAKDRNVEVTTINAGDSDSVVATKLRVAIEADAKFSAVVATNKVQAEASTNGPKDDAVAEDSGFVMVVLIQGSTLVDNVDEIILIHLSASCWRCAEGQFAALLDREYCD